jgi:uncharacterized membrane protein YphA (DoxX/SURF4 family)
MSASFGYYLVFGLIFVLVGTVVAYLSVSMVQNGGSFGSASILPESATTLFVGGFIVLVGLLLLLLGFLSTTRKHPLLYY